MSKRDVLCIRLVKDWRQCDEIAEHVGTGREGTLQNSIPKHTSGACGIILLPL